MARSAASYLLGFGALAGVAHLFGRKDAPKGTAAGPSSPETGPTEPSSSLTKEEIEGKPEYIHAGTPGYTRNIGKLPPEAGAFASQALRQPYGTVLGPQMLSDGRSYIAVTESHFDDHVTNPRTGTKVKHWHKGGSLLVQVG
jgi:hypothetical protein